MFFFNENSWLAAAIIIFLRYFLIAGVAYFVFYIWKKNKLSHLKIQEKNPTPIQIKKEFFYSMLSLLIYSATSGLVLYWYKLGVTKIYFDINEYGITYLIGSVFIMVVIHDTYFYWTHKLMHSYKWFYRFHKIHHSSHQPTPWAAFAFHPVEAFISLGIIPLIIFIIPTHPIALILFLIIMTIYNVLIHLGYEIFAKKSVLHFIGKWKNTTRDHDLHHEIGGRFNYGLYFSFWDRIMGTYLEKQTTSFEKKLL
ncbi:sterol desaturase family protein [Flavobacterium cellulosilyticum]|uniref:Sterol desaturase family protein n=1 Tax=Flavobacterium cellulosilyticum TaxID=2541731 RepID=A0A4R5CDN6_9FLAO|nr:sterol desaturase family protein [Flavobacterium cellulosilyticum]TDD96986.1 sterol desaturase family protein [Flavobacterium cellulosilyticum]